MTAEHAAAAGGEVEALVRGMVRLAETLGHTLPWANLTDACVGVATPDQLRWAIEDLTSLGEIEATTKGLRFALKEPAATRQSAADAVLATARRLCCGDNPAPEHNARADHSQRMAFAEELARAVRGS